jgi:hypothetical protein
LGCGFNARDENYSERKEQERRWRRVNTKFKDCLLVSFRLFLCAFVVSESETLIGKWRRTGK